MSADIDTANEIYNDEGIEVLAPSQRVISKEETEATVGHEVDDNWGLNRAYESADGVKHYSSLAPRRVKVASARTIRASRPSRPTSVGRTPSRTSSGMCSSTRGTATPTRTT
jgi:hypothetical protein